MAEKTTFTCDGCGVEKKDGFWWKAITKEIGISFYRWDASLPEATPKLHLCSFDCAAKKLREFMGAAVPVASADPIAELTAPAQYPNPPQESGSQTKATREPWNEHLEHADEQPQWTSNFLKGE